MLELHTITSHQRVKMRRKRQGQLDLSHSMPRTEIGRELGAMSKVLDEMPEIYKVAYQDLIGLKYAETGRTGMTAEQVVRAAILKQYRSLSYEELAFHLDDSASFRASAQLSRGRNCSGRSAFVSSPRPFFARHSQGVLL
jgi:transposase, IS5 family